MNLEKIESDSIKKSYSSLMVSLGIVTGLAFSSIYFGVSVYLFNYEDYIDVAFFTFWFVTVIGLIIFFISGILACLFVRKQNDIAKILIPNVIYVFGGNLALMIYFTISRGWYSTWVVIFSWIGVIGWVVWMFFLCLALLSGGAITGGYKIRPFKRKIEYLSLNTQHPQAKVFFCLNCGTKQYIHNKFCTSCGMDNTSIAQTQTE